MGDEAGSLAGRTLWRAIPAIATVVLYAPLLGAFPNELDSFDAFLVGHLAGHGQGSAWSPGGSFWLHENVCRLISPLSWTVRTWLFGVWMAGWYAVAIALQAGSATLVARLAERLGSGPARAAMLALVFAVSPIHARTVAGLGRDFDLFATLFMLAAILSADLGRFRRAAVFAALATMSKESGATVVPLLAGWMLLRFPPGERLVALKRLTPAALAVLAIVVLRSIQVGVAGSLEHAALPGKVFALDPTALLIAGPTFLLSCLGGWAQALLGGAAAQSVWAGAIVLVLLGAAGAIRAGLGFVGLAYVALVPALLVRDPTAATDFAWLADNARYGHLPLALLVLSAGAPARLARTSERVWRVLVGAVTGGAAAALTLALIPLSVDRPVARAFTEALPAYVGGDPRTLVITMADESPDAVRVALSQWTAARVGARVFVVPRGAAMALGRAEGAPWLDFGDGHLVLAPLPADGVRFARLTAVGALVDDAAPAPATAGRSVPVAVHPRSGRAARAEVSPLGVRVTVDDAPPEQRRAEVVGQLDLPPTAVGVFIEYRAQTRTRVAPGAGWLALRGRADGAGWAMALDWSGEVRTGRIIGLTTGVGPLDVVAPSLPGTVTLLRVEALLAQ